MKYILLLAALFFISCSNTLTVNIENKIALNRECESVVIEWEDVVSELGEVADGGIIVTDNNNVEIPSQLLFEGGERPTALLFQVNVGANSSVNYTIKKGSPKEYDTLTYGRFVPERFDDFAWENNKIAYRMYGPKLEAKGEISNGIDVWVKKTPSLVINKWYKKGYNYHKDHGEGLDYYKVGRTLGAGANTPIIGDSLVLSNNYTTYKILDSGAIRTEFELCYAPFDVNGVEVTQKRIVTLDANQNLNTISTIYSGDFDVIDVATGIVTLNETGEKIDVDTNYIAYAHPEHAQNGVTYVMVLTKDSGESCNAESHVLKRAKLKNGQQYTYKMGAYWSKSDVEDYSDWKKIVTNETSKFNNDLVITIN